MSMIWNDRWDAWKDSYDSWKLASPYDDWNEPEEFLFGCSACEDQGLMLGPDDEVIPCCECSEPVTLDDLWDFRGEEL